MNQLEGIDEYKQLIDKIVKKRNSNNEEILLIKEDLKKSKRDLFCFFVINSIWYFKGVIFFIKPSYLIIEIIFVSLVSFILTSVLVLFYDIMNTNKKIIKAKESEQDFLLNELSKREVILEKLKNNNQDVTIFNEDSKELRDKSYLYYDCGYNEREYSRYYNRDKLYDELGEKYSDEYILEIERYLEENDKVKRKIRGR